MKRILKITGKRKGGEKPTEVTVNLNLRKSLEEFQNEFAVLETTYPNPAGLFKEHFSSSTEIPFNKIKTLDDEKKLISVAESFIKSCRSGVTISNEIAKEYGWSVDTTASPIFAGGKKCIGLAGANFSKSILFALGSVFQQLESEML
jgi:hypothetical protein